METQDAIDQAFVALAKGNEAQAAEYGRIALRQDPQNPAVQTIWGRLALTAPKLQLALSIFEKITQQPCLAENWLDVERALVALRREEDAAVAAQCAVEVDPESSNAWAHLGDVLLSLNRRDEAAAAFRHLIKIDPIYPKAFLGLTRAAKVAPDAPETAHILEMLDKGGLTDRQQSNLHYALSHIYKAAGDDDAFISHLFAANKKQRQDEPLSRDYYTQLFDRLEAGFTASNFAQAQSADPSTPIPIFVLGMPRSGTTLVEQIIGGHRDVVAAGELKYSRHPFTPAFEKMTGELFPLGFEKLDAAQWNGVVAFWVQVFKDIARGAKYVTDKTPGNYRLVGMLPLLFPGCKIIATRRNAMDTCFSILQQPFEDNATHAHDIDLLAYAYARYERLMRMWEDLCPEKFMTQRYEDLVRAPEAESKKLMAHCGLDWSPDLLALHERNTPVHTFSTQQVRQPVHTSSIGAWRRYAGPLESLRKALIAEGVAVD